MEEKKSLSFKEIEEKTEESLNTFVFIVFISNPMNKSIKIWIDGDDNAQILTKDKFIDIMSNTCGQQEANKIEYACFEYGVPYLYDRANKRVQQLNEMPNGNRLNISQDYHKPFEKINNVNTMDSLFESTKGLYDKTKGFGMPQF